MRSVARGIAKRLLAISEAYRRLGGREGTLFVCARALEQASQGRVRLFRYHFVAQPVATASTTLRPNGQLVVRRAVAGDPLVSDLPRPSQVLDRRFRSGDTCFLAEKDRRLVGCLWLAENDYAEDEVRCHYSWQPHGQASWDYDVYVVPEYRSSRALLRLWEAAHRSLSEKGVNWTLSRISTFNSQSLNAHKRLGARRIGSGTFLVIGSVQVALLSMAPYLHISIRPASGPHLVFLLQDPPQ